MQAIAENEAVAAAAVAAAVVVQDQSNEEDDDVSVVADEVNHADDADDDGTADVSLDDSVSSVVEDSAATAAHLVRGRTHGPTRPSKLWTIWLRIWKGQVSPRFTPSIYVARVHSRSHMRKSRRLSVRNHAGYVTATC